MDAAIRFRVNYFLLYALTEAMDSQTGERQPLELHDEDKWSFGPVQYKDMAVTLSGHPSYAMWNGDEDEAASNVILVRGRMRGEPEECIAEVLGYMGRCTTAGDVFSLLFTDLVQGFIYHHRRNANKANHPLYGVATDSRTFHFVRLDNDSTVYIFSISRLIVEYDSNDLQYVTATVDSRVDLEKAFSLLVRVFKEAMTVPPVLQEPSTQSARGWRPAKSLVPIQSSLRRKVDRKAQYRRLKADGSDGLFEDIDDEELRDYIEHETSEDEYHEDQGNPDAWTWLKRCCHNLFV